MPINKRYSILAQRSNFTNTGVMSVKAFDRFFDVTHKFDLKISIFIEFCKPFHLSIVDTLYRFASFSRQTSLIIECKTLQSPALNYTFDKIQRLAHYNGCAWFVLPKKFVWFTHKNGQVKASRYITREDEFLIVDNLKPQENYLALGVISCGIIYPLRIDTPQYSGNW